MNQTEYEKLVELRKQYDLELFFASIERALGRRLSESEMAAYTKMTKEERKKKHAKLWQEKVWR
jgi:hypothetical protein